MKHVDHLLNLVVKAICCAGKDCTKKISEISGYNPVEPSQAAVAEWNKTDKSRTMCTSRPNWLSLSTKFYQKDQGAMMFHSYIKQF